MDKNAYRSELNEVRYTDRGRTELIDRLMEARAEARPVRRRWVRQGAAAVLAAVLLVGSAVAAVGPLWERYFGQLDENQQAVIDSLSTEPDALPAAESGGAVMTPLAAFGDQDFYYLMLEIQAPEGTVLPDYDEDEGYYQLFGDEPGERMTLTDGEERELYNYMEFQWMPRTAEENVLTAVIRIWPEEGVDFTDGADKFLHIPGLWVQDPEKNYTPVLTGSWDFNIGAHHGAVESRELDVNGVTQGAGECGILVLDSPADLPTGDALARPLDQSQEGVWPGAEIAVVTKDGSEVSLENTMGGCEEDWSEDYGPFETPIDLDQIAAVRWGDALIPVN